MIGLCVGRGWLRYVRMALAGAGVATLLICLAFGALMVRLSMGPIEIDRIGARAAAALSERSGLDVRFGATQISRSEHGPTIEVRRLTAASQGRAVLEAPSATLSLDPFALLRFEIRPKWLEAHDLHLTLQVTPDGSFAFSPDGAAGAQDASRAAPEPALSAAELAARGQAERANIAGVNPLARAAAALLSRLVDFATSPSSALAGVQHVGMSRATVTIDDQTLGRKLRFSDVAVALEKRGPKAALIARAQGPNGPLSARVVAEALKSGERRLDYEARDFSIDEVNLIAGLRRPPVDTDSPLSAQGYFTIDSGGALGASEIRLNVGKGFLRVDDPDHEPLFYDEISAMAHWERGSRRITLDHLQFYAGESRFRFAGAFQPPANPADGWSFDVGLAEPGGLAPERPGETFYPIERIGLLGKLFPAANRLELTKFAFSSPGVSIHVAAQVAWADGLKIHVDAGAENTEIRPLMRVLPSLVAARPRGWLREHVRAGVLTRGNARIDFTGADIDAMRRDLPPADSALAINFEIAGGAVTPLEGLPVISGVSGTGTATGRSMRFAAASGAIDPTGKKLSLSDVVFSMPDNDGVPATPASIEGHIDGSMEAVARILDNKIISPHASLPVEADAIKGAVEGRLRIDFKVGSEANGADVKVGVNAKVTNFVLDKIAGKAKFEAPLLVVTGDSRGVQANGAGRIFGAPVNLDLRKGVGQSAVAQLSGSLDEAARARNGLAIAGVTGPVGFKAVATFAAKGPKIAVDLDLTRTRLNHPAPGIVKEAGRAGKAAFLVNLQNGGGARIDELAIDAGAFVARGSVDLNGAGDFVAARFSSLKLSAGDDMRLDAQKSGDGYKLVVRGGSIDIRPFVGAITRETVGERKESPNLEIDIKSPILSGYAKRILSNADFKISLKDGVFRAFAGSAAFGRAPLTISMSRGDLGYSQINIATTDAGALLAFTDLYGRMEGGELSTSMHIEGGVVAGVLSIRNFYLREEPALRKLVAEGVAKTENGVRKFDPGLVKFSRLQTNFLRNGSRIDLRDGMMSGGDIGLTIEGSFNEARNTMSLSGTFVPAFAINNFFSKIPVLGMVLGGGWNEGLLAINYKLTGKLTAPVVSVNPLSAVTPGFLRKLFGAFDNGDPGGQ